MSAFEEVFTTAVVSTAHLPPHLANVMDLMENPLRRVIHGIGDHREWESVQRVVYDKTGYGYRILAESDVMPEEIIPLMLAARNLGFKWVEFDRDGEIVEGFKTWDW